MRAAVSFVGLMIVGTGHRLNRLGGYGPRVRKRLFDLAVELIRRFKPGVVVTGMALGWDTALAEAAVATNTPFIACVPFRGQELLWREADQEHYRELLSQAAEVRYATDFDAGTTKLHKGSVNLAMQKRNRMMLDLLQEHGEGFVAALYDGGGRGGTARCVKDAERQDLRVVNLWSSWQKHAGI